MASDTFSNWGNDEIEERLYSDWTEEEKQNFIEKYNQWNGDDDRDETLPIQAGILASFFAKELSKG